MGGIYVIPVRVIWDAEVPGGISPLLQGEPTAPSPWLWQPPALGTEKDRKRQKETERDRKRQKEAEGDRNRQTHKH